MTAKLRVLMVSDVSPSSPDGGGERMLWEHASRLAARGHDVRVLYRSPDSEAGPRLEREGVHIRRTSVGRRSLPGFVLTSFLAARRPTTPALRRAGSHLLHQHHHLAGHAAHH